MNDLQRPDDTPRPSGRLRRFALGIVGGGLAGLVLSLIVLAVLRREPLPTFGFDELNAATQRWADSGPHDYDMDLELRASIPAWHTWRCATLG